MRKLNAILSMGILALFLIHAIAGGFQLTGLIPGGNTLMQVLAWIMTGLIAVHAGIGIKLTSDTLKACRKSGANYYSDNRLFWARRTSGFAIMLFILFHVFIFLGSSRSGAFRLHLFSGAQLISQILLAVTVAVHVLTNIKPLMLALGVRRYKDFVLDIIAVLSVILLFTGAAFVIYYIRWNVI